MNLNDAHAAHLAGLFLAQGDDELAIDAENERQAALGIPDAYWGLTPSEQADAVDADNREEEAERQARAFLMGPDAYWR